MTYLHRHLPRRSVVALVLSLIGVFFFVSSAEAHGGHLQKFLIVSTDPDESSSPTVLGFGKIHAKGTDHVVNDYKDVFVFPKGSITVKHKPAKPGRDSFDPKTCLFKYSEYGWYWVTGGTGAYRDAEGHGKYTVSAFGVGCDPQAPPETFVLQIKAKGPLDF